MADFLDLITNDPATLSGMWGLAGAFIYCGPRWLACVYGVDTLKWDRHWRCTSEAALSLAVGATSAAAFAGWAMHWLKPTGGDLPAVAAMIGLLANPIAPKLVDGLSTRAADAIVSRFAKRAPPPDEEPKA